MGWREWSRRRAVRIGALTALLGVVVVLQAFTRESVLNVLDVNRIEK